MAGYTKAEALAFIDSMRMTVANRVGFKWLTEKLAGLSGYIETVADENAMLNAYLDETGARDDFESYRVARAAAAAADAAAGSEPPSE